MPQSKLDPIQLAGAFLVAAFLLLVAAQAEASDVHEQLEEERRLRARKERELDGALEKIHELANGSAAS